MGYPFMAARWFTRTAGRAIDLIVVHSMEAPEKGTTAESCARYFATTDRKASAHYCVDDTSVIQSVRDRDVAYHAPGANRNGIGIEHAGYARQTRAEWLDPYSRRMLELHSAPLAAALCRAHNIPVTWLTPSDLRDGKRGITSHHHVSLAWGKSHHWDPGPHFPVGEYLAWIAALMGDSPHQPPQEEERTVWIISIPDPNGGVFITDGITARRLRSQAEIDELTAAGAKFTSSISRTTFDRLVLVGDD